MKNSEIKKILSTQFKNKVMGDKEQKEKQSLLKQFNALDLPLYFKNKMLDWFYRVRVKNGKVDVTKIMLGSVYFCGISDIDSAFDAENNQIDQAKWNEVVGDFLKNFSD
tara:strand:+ start:2663 stop:2989 length:327 start_codon:yes stop_codon:yes gene_type:complete